MYSMIICDNIMNKEIMNLKESILDEYIGVLAGR